VREAGDRFVCKADAGGPGYPTTCLSPHSVSLDSTTDQLRYQYKVEGKFKRSRDEEQEIEKEFKSSYNVRPVGLLLLLMLFAIAVRRRDKIASLKVI